VALALMLLVGSTLMIRSLHTLMTSASGVNPEGVATLELTLARTDHPGAEGRRRFYESVLSRLSADPRVDVAAAINELPMRGVEGIALSMYPKDREPRSDDDATYAQFIRVTPDYFRAMQIRMLAGRPPLPVAIPEGSHQEDYDEVVISEALARIYWPDRSPLGERLTWPGGTFLIVGVVADVRPTTLESEFIPQTYTAMMGSPDMNGALIVRGPGDPGELATLLVDAVHAVAPTQAVYNVRSMEQVIDGAIQSRRTNTFLITAFGALALALASVGVYGVMAFSVARRTREIGIRIALGARGGRVMRAVMREGLALALIGTAVGLGGAWALARVMESLLYGVTTRDPLTFVVAPVALLAFALVAALVPAWRATRVNPVDAIRTE
jgi:predicted permease